MFLLQNRERKGTNFRLKYISLRTINICTLVNSETMERLNILWTTDNKDTIFNMLSMYASNSLKNNWWDEVNVIIWGASSKLVGNDTQVQTEVLEMIAKGVKIEACKACSDSFGVSGVLIKLGINVKYMGQPLTDYLKAGEKILTI